MGTPYSIALLRSAAMCVLYAGCSVGELSSVEKECPCAPNWSCEPSTNRCLPDFLVNDAGVDSADMFADISLRDAFKNPDVSPDVPVDGELDQTLEIGLDGEVDAEVDAVLDTVPDAVIPDAILDTVADAMPTLSRCRDLTTLLCEDFEAPAIPGWFKYGNTPGISTTTQNPLLDQRSLLAKTLSAGQQAGLNKAISTITSDVYIRLHVRPRTPNADFSFLAFSINAPPFSGVNLSRVNNKLELFHRETGRVTQTSQNFVHDQWNCVLLELNVDNTNGFAKVSINNGPTSQLTGLDTLPNSGYRGVNVGVTFTGNASGPIEAQFDELVISAQPLRCD